MVTLTIAEFEAMASAVAIASEGWWAEDERRNSLRQKKLDSAWEKVKADFYASPAGRRYRRRARA